MLIRASSAFTILILKSYLGKGPLTSMLTQKKDILLCGLIQGAPTASFSFLGAILVFTALATLGNI